MPNPDPNRATRFRPGRSGNPGGKPKGPERVTILRAAPKIRSLEEVRADPRGWRGRMVDLLRSVAEDPEQPIELRLSCANSLLRFEGAAADDTQTRPNPTFATRGRQCGRGLDFGRERPGRSAPQVG